METADIFVVNKADQPGADRLEADLRGVLSGSRQQRSAPIIQMHQGDDTGLALLTEEVDRCLEITHDPTHREQRRRTKQRYRVQQLLQRRLADVLNAQPESTWDRTAHAICTQVLGELGGRRG
jgi:LAO/AO transport system kinase